MASLSQSDPVRNKSVAPQLSKLSAAEEAVFGVLVSDLPPQCDSGAEKSELSLTALPQISSSPSSLSLSEVSPLSTSSLWPLLGEAPEGDGIPLYAWGPGCGTGPSFSDTAGPSAEEEAQCSAQELLAMRARQAEKNREQHGFRPEEDDLFHRFEEIKEANRQTLRAFVEQLRPYLPQAGQFHHCGSHLSGTRIDRRKFVTQTGSGDGRIFKRRCLKLSNEPCLYACLLLDNTRSMCGQKLEESLKAVFFLLAAMKELEQPFALISFGETAHLIKSFTDEYDSAKARIKVKILKHFDASERVTDLSAGLALASSQMREIEDEFPTVLGLLGVISDGSANAGVVGFRLRDQIRAMQKKMLVANFLLSTDSVELKRSRLYFGERAVVQAANFSELPPLVLNYLKRALYQAASLQEEELS